MMRMRRFSGVLCILSCGLVLLVILLSSCSRSGSPAPIEVIGVRDGDSFKALVNGVQTDVRLYGIDAPEWQQPYSRKSAQALQEMLKGHAVTIKPMSKDRYGRIVALVYADGKNVDEAMIKAGWAWFYPQYCTESFCEAWRQSEAKARRAKIGLWQEPVQLPPWEFRAQERARKERKTAQAQADGAKYSGNVRSMKFHRAGCKHFHCKNCTRFFAGREEAVKAGFTPCGGCNP